MHRNLTTLCSTEHQFSNTNMDRPSGATFLHGRFYLVEQKIKLEASERLCRRLA